MPSRRLMAQGLGQVTRQTPRRVAGQMSLTLAVSSKKDWESVSLGANPLCRWFWIVEDVIPYFS